jgi:hypothetical protein
MAAFTYYIRDDGYSILTLAFVNAPTESRAREVVAHRLSESMTPMHPTQSERNLSDRARPPAQDRSLRRTLRARRA